MNEITRGQQAQRLMEDEVLLDALKTLETQYLDAWRKTEPGDTNERERLFLAVQVVEEFRKNLRVVVEAGKLQQAHLERMKGRKATS